MSFPSFSDLKEVSTASFRVLGDRGGHVAQESSRTLSNGRTSRCLMAGRSPWRRWTEARGLKERFQGHVQAVELRNSRPTAY